MSKDFVWQGPTLRKLREAKGWSRADLVAQYLLRYGEQLSERTIVWWESPGEPSRSRSVGKQKTGKTREPRGSQVYRLAALLGLPPDRVPGTLIVER